MSNDLLKDPRYIHAILALQAVIDQKVGIKICDQPGVALIGRKCVANARVKPRVIEKIRGRIDMMADLMGEDFGGEFIKFIFGDLPKTDYHPVVEQPNHRKRAAEPRV